MLFNSLDFALFLPITFFVYWSLKKYGLKPQNTFLFLASYYFYACWDWRFLGLIIFSTILDYFVALKIESAKSRSTSKGLLTISLFANSGVLGFFKYYNFFLDNFTKVFTFLGQDINPGTLNIILPVGISFYTFQTLSYTIDVYRGDTKASKDIVAFATYVSFFPQLVAGPIERSSNLLPQFLKKRSFNQIQAVNGLRQILWGLFKKMVIADNCGCFADMIFNHYEQYSGMTLLLGAFMFAIQIYGDFSGYSDIAIGTSRLFGFNLKQNFAFPYFSRDVAEFWRRWHISLSTWFRDYLYIPLGGSKGSTIKKVRNTFIIFLVSGFWHGANWTFIAWGAVNAIYFLPLLLSNRNRKNIGFENSKRKPLKDLPSIVFTFFITCLAWVFFRAPNIHSAINVLGEVFTTSLSKSSLVEVLNFVVWRIEYILPLLLVLFFAIEWKGRKSQYAIEKMLLTKGTLWRQLFYASIVLCIVFFSKTGETPFIYFDF